MNAEDLCYLPATEMAQAIREKKLSPVEITEALLARMDAVNPSINAYCTPTPEIALAAAKAAEQQVMDNALLLPLAGIPFSVKDLLLTKGVRTMRGSKIYENFVPDEDTPAVTRLLRAGGVMLGKTTTPEFGWKGVTDSAVTGITRNPWNLKMTPGGSSGGAAAQVAAGLGPLAIGTDGGGSIRIPAAFSGVYGIKPSFGRVPTYPASHHDMLSHTGPITRTVADAALMLGVMAGPHPADRFSLEAQPADYLGQLEQWAEGLTVAWSPDLGYAKVDPDVAHLAADAAHAFTELGCAVEEVNPGFGDPTEDFITVYLMALAGGLADSMPEWGAQMDPGLVALSKEGLGYSGTALIKAQIARHQYWDKVRRFFEKYDLLLTPSLAVPAFPVGQLVPDGWEADLNTMFSWTPFSYPFNFTGNPAASVPAGFTPAGLPVGLQIVGPRFDDLLVLQASRAFEQARPWAKKRPKL